MKSLALLTIGCLLVASGTSAFAREVLSRTTAQPINAQDAQQVKQERFFFGNLGQVFSCWISAFVPDNAPCFVPIGPTTTASPAGGNNGGEAPSETPGETPGGETPTENTDGENKEEE